MATHLNPGSTRGTTVRGQDSATALINAAIRQLAHDGRAARVTEICREACVPRQTAYRMFPDGLEDIERAIHGRTLNDVLERMVQSVGELGAVSFPEAVMAGVQAAMAALHESLWVQTVLRRDPVKAAGYLLGSGGVVTLIGRYAARCAASFGSLAPELPAHGEKFARRLFSDWISQMPSDSETSWPEPCSEDIHVEIELFERAVGLTGTIGAEGKRLGPGLINNFYVA